jgi:hypothetical protein
LEEKILTLHPEGKAGVNISKAKYDQIRKAILGAIRAHREISFKELPGEVESRLAGGFEGSIGWYVTTVKLDLEARGEIERVPGKSPQRLRLTSD